MLSGRKAQFTFTILGLEASPPGLSLRAQKIIGRIKNIGEQNYVELKR